jgi:hypothetical protein
MLQPVVPSTERQGQRVVGFLGHPRIRVAGARHSDVTGFGLDVVEAQEAGQLPDEVEVSGETDARPALVHRVLPTSSRT